MKWIEEHVGFILFIFLCIGAIEGGIYCWRMPKEFRERVMPKLLYISDYETRINKEISDLSDRSEAIDVALLKDLMDVQEKVRILWTSRQEK